MRGLGEWMRKYGATVFVVMGLAVVGVTVTQVQQQQRLATKAAGEAEARALGVWFEPGKVMVDEQGKGKVRLKLETLVKDMTNSRLAFEYDPGLLEIMNVTKGSIFSDVDIQQSAGKLVLISEGRFFGSGTWVQIEVRLKTDASAKLVSDGQLSSLRYEGGESVGVGVFDLEISR